MQNSKVVKRYAKALFQVGLDENLLKEFSVDIIKLKKVVEESKDLQMLFKSPVIKSKIKIALIKKIFTGKLNQTIINFLSIIINAGREAYIYSITQEFDKLYKDYMGIKSAEITSVIQLDDNIKNQIIKELENYTNSKIILKETTNEKLIGGIILSIEDKQFDNSIKTQLNKLRKELIE